MMNSEVANTAYLEYVLPFSYKNYLEEGNDGYETDSDKEGYTLEYQVPFISSSFTKGEGDTPSSDKSPGFELLFIFSAIAFILFIKKKSFK